MNDFSDSETLKLISLVMIEVTEQRASKELDRYMDIVIKICSGQKQLASDMQMKNEKVWI